MKLTPAIPDPIHAKDDEPQPNSSQDQELWNSFRQGDMASYAVIYRKYFFILYGYGRKICQNEELVKDCVQDLFLKIWNNRETLSDTTSVKYYLFTSLRNKLLDHLRSNQHQYEKVLSAFETSILDQIPVADVGEDARKDKVLGAINKLSAYQQKILRLKFSDERTNKEIADELGITIQSVYNSVFKTLRVIRKQVLTILVTLSFFG
jgi:RNA polymerase sigma factor (sigma-70 family)